MPLASISDISYTYPTPQDFERTTEPVSIQSLKNWFDEFLLSPDSLDSTKGAFFRLRDNLLSDLNSIFGKTIQLSKEQKYDHINFASFVSQYADDCVEAVNAYKFYGNQIVAQINKLTDYLKKANDILAKWDNLNVNNVSDQAVSDLIHADVVDLECLMKFCLEIESNFSTRYIYDFDEDNWKRVDDNYTEGNGNFQIKDKKKPGTPEPSEDYDDLSDLRSTEVKCDRRKEEGKTKPLECFNEINLLDRLKYIKVYYDLTENGKTDYVFPNDKAFGLPCVNDDEEGKTRYIANIEKFYLGYLIDRDGPVNAFAGFFEMKVKALEESIGIKQQELKAYEAYLNFINRGLEMLNSSQSSGKNSICDGAIIALTYLCGQKMYRLFEQNGVSYLVLTNIEGKNFLVENSPSGMFFLLGDNGKGKGNSICRVTNFNTNLSLWDINHRGSDNKIIGYSSINSSIKQVVITDFTLPEELDIRTVEPKSVYKYSTANAENSWWTADDGKATDDHVSWDAVISSWTKAFQTKTTYLDTALQNTQTDIQVFRDTINTFESLTKTLRSRTHDAGLNVVNKLIS